MSCEIQAKYTPVISLVQSKHVAQIVLKSPLTKGLIGMTYVAYADVPLANLKPTLAL